MSGLVGVGQEGWAVLGEIAFEDEDGGDLIDQVLSVDAGGVADRTLNAACFVENRVGFAGGKALVKEMMLECGVGFAEGLSERLGLGSLRAGGAVGVERVADDEDFDLVLPDEPGEGLEVGAQGRAVQGEERLGGKAELVRNGEADAFVSDIEGEGARNGHVP